MSPDLTNDALLWLAFAALAGLLIGVLLTSVWALRRIGALQTREAALSATLRSQDALDQERDDAIALARDQLKATFEGVASQSLRSNSESFLQLAHERLTRQSMEAHADFDKRSQAVDSAMAPIAKALADTRTQLERLERDRQHAFGAIEKHLETMGQTQQSLQAETAHLVNALKRPQVRGQWGEITLRRLVELAGMTHQVDFVEQVHTPGDEGALRPDMVIKLPDNRELIVDVKTPLDAYLAAVEATEPAERDKCLARYARQIRDRIRELSDKKYWAQFSRSPEFVVLFIPGDQFLGAALDTDPQLLDEALRRKVILATPTSFIALLKAVAYGWRQLALADNAEKIRELAESLHQRLGSFAGHLAAMGRHLGGSVDAYNRAVGSLERSVLPGARKFTELGIQSVKPLPTVAPIDRAPRTVEAPDATPASDEKHETDH